MIGVEPAQKLRQNPFNQLSADGVAFILQR